MHRSTASTKTPMPMSAVIASPPAWPGRVGASTSLRLSSPGWTPTGRSFTGKRMSGQEVTLPLAVVPSLDFAGIVRPRCEVGLFDMSGFPDALAHVDGFLSLSFLSEVPFTVDYGRKVIREAVGLPGTAVDVRVVRDGPSLTVLAPLTIAGGRSVWVEVDM